MNSFPRVVQSPLSALIATLGPLRVCLVVLVTVAIAGAAFAGGEIVYTFPAVIPTLLAPPFAVMVAFMVTLDVLMTCLFLSEKTGEDRRRLRNVLAIELALLAILIAVWAPFFSNLARR